MFVLRMSYVHLLEAVACQCQLPFHSYIREVADDGSVVGGVEIEVPVRDEPAGLRTHFFGAILVQRWLFCTSSLP
jgi:hypothetical protein